MCITYKYFFFRIACNPSQPVFELDRTSCLKNPGCYYDDELATLRRFFGEQILPGVPACHLVVRNHNFHRSVKNEKMMVFLFLIPLKPKVLFLK